MEPRILRLLQSQDFSFIWSLSTLTALAAILVTYPIVLALYRVTFHPLAKFPGPKLAAMTLWYEFYYEVILWGQFTNRIEWMHKNYGPIVRIGPDELHCTDLSFADEIYGGAGRIRDKGSRDVNTWSWILRQSSFATKDHNLHRMRRGALNKMFSTASITRLEPMIQQLAQKLCNRILATKGTFDVPCAYSCFTVDVITDYCFDSNKGFLDQDSWYPNFRDANDEVVGMANITRQLPWVNVVMDLIPLSVIKKLNPSIGYMLDEVMVKYPKMVKKVIADFEAGKGPNRPTVFNAVLESNIPDKEKAASRLHGEAQAVVGAGAETTSWSLAVGTFYLLYKPELLDTLTKELMTVVKDPESLPPWRVLEELPYLTGVIKESIRLAYGVAIRTMRVAPTEDLVYRGKGRYEGKNFVIPKGFAIGMTNRLMNIDEDVFPDPETYDPMRWINENGGRNREREALFQPFGRGSRRCIGINLAYCELYYAFAALALRVFPRLALYETTVKDVKYHHDEFVSTPVLTSKGVRARVVDPTQM